MKLAIVGCGYVAAMYARNAAFHPEVTITRAFDIDPERCRSLCEAHGISPAASLSEVLDDPEIALVLNLTNPRAHFDVTKACLEAGKHVYTEKPLAMEMTQAAQLRDLAQARSLRIGCAPCGVLSNTAQTVWKALRDGAVGKVRLVYANYDDGMIAPQMQPWTWTNGLGVPWPARDEFEVGCTFEHAGYFLTWLNAFFGPAQGVTAFSSCQIPEKGIPVDGMAPDFSVGCIEYDGGIVARVTCGLVAPRDKSLMIVGDEGYLVVGYLRNDHEPVYLRRYQRPKNVHRFENMMSRLRRRTTWLTSRLPWPTGEVEVHEKVPFALPVRDTSVSRDKRVDFMLGPVEMARAIREGRPHRLSLDFGLHVLEQVQALQHPDPARPQRILSSRFDRIEPLPPGGM